MSFERRSSICIFVLEIQLMRKFVKHDILSVARIACTMARRVPCQYERTQTATSVAKPVFRAFFPDSATDVTHVLFGVSSWIDENRGKIRVIVGVAMEK